MRSSITSRQKIVKYLSPRVFITAVVYILLFSNVRDISSIIGSFDLGYGSFDYKTSLAMSSLVIMSLTWVAYDVLVNVASSLGYKEKGDREFAIIGNTGTINLSHPDLENRDQARPSYVFKVEKYQFGDPLSALSQSRSRTYTHIERLQNSSIVNLFIGIMIAFIGILTIGTTFFEIEKYVDKTQGFNVVGFLMFAVLPRLSIALIVQIFSFFFLMMYRSNISDIRYFQNEITNIDAFAAALSCLKKENDPNTKIVIAALLKTERNRLASKNQKVINPSNDEGIMEALSRIESDLSKKLPQARSIQGVGN